MTIHSYTWPARLTPVELTLATTEELPTTTTINFDWEGRGLRETCLLIFSQLRKVLAKSRLYLSDTTASVRVLQRFCLFLAAALYRMLLYTLFTGRLRFRNCLPCPGPGPARPETLMMINIVMCFRGNIKYLSDTLSCVLVWNFTFWHSTYSALLVVAWHVN